MQHDTEVVGIPHPHAHAGAGSTTGMNIVLVKQAVFDVKSNDTKNHPNPLFASNLQMYHSPCNLSISKCMVRSQVSRSSALLGIVNSMQTLHHQFN